MKFEGVISYIVINIVNVTDSFGNIFEFTPIDADIPQTSEIENSTYENIQTEHIIQVYNKAEIFLKKVNFRNWTSYNHGAAIFAGYKDVQINLNDCIFNSNFAIFGGIFYSEYGNKITCTKCIFEFNTAILGGVSYMIHDSSFIIENSIFDHNWAMLYPLLYFAYSKDVESSCTLCDINSNIIPDNAATVLKARLVGHSTLQSLVDSYYSRTNDLAAIKLENGNIRILTSRAIRQDYFISAISDSIVYIDSLEYLSPTAASIIVNCQASFLSIKNADLKTLQVEEGSNLANNEIPYLFEVLVGSSFIMTNTNFSTVELPILKCQNSKVYIETVILATISQSGTDMVVTRNCEVTITDLNLTNVIVSNIDQIIHIQQNSILTIINSNFDSFNARLLKISDSNLTLTNSSITSSTLIGGNRAESGTAIMGKESNLIIENSVLSNLDSTVNGGAISVSQSLSKRKNTPNSLTLKHSNFTNNNSGNKGGSIYVKNVDIIIEDMRIINSSSSNGGGIFLSCSINTSPECIITITSLIAESNQATKYGGVISTDMFKPNITNSTFSGNTAGIYGQDMAAYPLSIEINSRKKITVVSGQSVGEILSYVAYDFFGQVAFNLGNKLSSLKINSSEIKLQEQTRASSNNGKFVFSSTVIVGLPGTSALDLDKYNKIYNTNYQEFTIDSAFDIRF